MLTEEEIKKAIELDDAAAAVGGYINTTAQSVPYRIRDMHKYCLAQGKDIERLTIPEREMFRVTAKSKAL